MPLERALNTVEEIAHFLVERTSYATLCVIVLHILYFLTPLYMCCSCTEAFLNESFDCQLQAINSDSLQYFTLLVFFEQDVQGHSDWVNTIAFKSP